MKKRQFLSNTMTLLTGVVVGATVPGYAAAARQLEEQAILTVTGDILRTNRGKFDPMTDQLMHKHGVHFDRAFQFTLADLDKLAVVTIHPTMEDDARSHRLSGPLLSDVLHAAGMNKDSATKILLHGIDGYSPEINLELVRKYNFVVATRIDEKLLHIGGFGPLFALYDADRIPEIAQKPLKQRFAGCPWGLYCIEVA